MRNTLPLLSRPQAPNSSLRAPSPLPSNTPSHPVPTIRLISATPSAAGSAGDASTSFASSSYASIAPFASSPLAPKQETAEVPRKRLVPKKSKLGLLGAGKTKEKANKDFSDVVRRVGGAPSTGRSGFEIYVDQGDDPEMGEIVVVKKKKSRLGLNGMSWGALGEVTNIPAAPKEAGAKDHKEKAAPADGLLKVKGDENQKWWSIGRGRKDSKSKEKDKEQKPPARSKTPEPAKPFEGRARFNSLDSGILLNSPASRPEKKKTASSSVTSLLEIPVIQTPIDGAFPEDLPTSNLLTADAPPTGSIAVRAIRSMRSLARMASWAQLSNDKEGNPGPAPAEAVKSKSKEKKETKEKKKDEKRTKDEGEPKKKKKKDKEKTKEKESREKERTIRYSGSSFEAGALGAQASPAPPRTSQDGARTLTTRRKQSVLGLGLPSTMRLSTVRDVSGSSAGSATGVPQAPQRLSVDSAHLILNAQGRPSSILSSGSSLRPPSTVSGISVESGRSGRSSTSSAASVRWDEAGIRSVKEIQRQERRTRREKEDKERTAEGGKTKRDSRHSSESRRRTPISEIFPDVQTRRDSAASLSPPASLAENPLVRVEEATADGHSPPTDDEKAPPVPSLGETPPKRARARPMSEQMLGRPRPQAICDNSEGDAFLSLLDAATNDLASLINRLDLEATPGSTTNTPLRLSPLQLSQESPLKARAAALRGSPLRGELRESTASISSLRPYAKSQTSSAPPKLALRTSQTLIKPKGATLVGQQIAPWNELDWKVSPRKPLVMPKQAPQLTHKRTLTPSPEVPMPVFHPLRPANNKSKASLLAEPASRSATPPISTDAAAPSSRTFGSRPSKVGLRSPPPEDDKSSPTPVFSRAGGQLRKGSSLVPMNSKGSVGSLRRMGVPITAEGRKGLGLAGTLGGSTEPEVDPEDPDSDIPDELQVILSGQSDDDMTRPLSPFEDTLSFRPPPSPGSPPKSALPTPEVSVHEDDVEAIPQLPVFQAQLFDAESHQVELDDGDHVPTSPSEDDTRKSFDFTGELRKLNESGGSDRASFVEQVEQAFKTPGRIQLGFDFGLDESMLAPPVPALPKSLRAGMVEDVPQSFSHAEDTTSMYGGSDESGARDSGISQVNEHDISLMMRELEDECRVYPDLSKSTSTVRSKRSDGRLNTDFKFGGKPNTADTTTDTDIAKQLTLSDIIPPVSHSRTQSHSSIIEEDSSVLKSILAKATDILPGESSGSKHRSQASVHFDETAGTHGHSRTESAASFTGFESFDEVRRGFEFHPNRPAFYPPANAVYSRPTNPVFRPAHARDVSLFSIASVSSYGAALNNGARDPFGYEQEGPSRPPSMDDISIAMSMSVDDTFSFIRNKPRRRVDSDASSFYFQTSNTMHPYRRHRRGPSAMSVASNAGPPVSLYNRSFGAHRRNDSSVYNHRRDDSNTSASSVALSYAMHGAGSSRAAWASHTRDFSVDSIMSDYSERPIARPGLGDKMFDNAHGAPLSAISASPESAYSEPEEVNRTSWDSIMDHEPYTATGIEDSIFDRTNKRNSVSSESVFGFDPSYAQTSRYHPTQRFRPLSIMSEMSVHSPVKEDDTMITMLGGGHVRRRSVSSLVDSSPCVRMEKKHAAISGRVLKFDAEPPAKESPKEPRLLAQPSIASTSSFQFGGERMIKARQGLLERQSLEESALMAQGEELLASLRENSIFSKPSPAGRSRSSTCSTSASSGADTPPLSSSDGSSVSGGSQSSIDVGHLSALLTNATHPSSGVARARLRARARGTGHRRRIDEARMSRSSVYETIQEEASVSSSPAASTSHPTPQHASKLAASPMINDSVYVVESDRDSILSESWDDENGITTLRRYYALRNEAQVTVDESKRVWLDTPFSVYALQSFQPPHEPNAMQAMLEHSQKNYGPLPSELHPHRVRSRTSSRASPYPLRNLRSNMSPEKPLRSSPIQVFTDAPSKPFATSSAQPQYILREVQRPVNIPDVPTPPPVLGEIKPFTPFNVELDTSKVKHNKNGMGLPARPRVTSSTRRAALGWSKRSSGKSSTQDCKENVSTIVPTPSETLRINRPRPRGRPTPARVPVPAA